MRRGLLSNISLILVMIAGVFSLLSIFLDQQVIQKEDLSRNLEIEIQTKVEKINELNVNSMSILMLEDRVQSMTNYYTFYSTIFYKIFLHLETDVNFRKNFNEYAKSYMTQFIYTDIKDIIYDLSAVRNELITMSFYYYEFTDKKLEKRIKKLLNNKNNKSLIKDSFDFIKSKESLLAKIENNNNFKDDLLSSDEVYEIYKSLFQLNKQFAVAIKTLNDTSKYFDKTQELLEDELTLVIINAKKIKVWKNYFILLSILSQILSLMTLLFLFRNIIKER